MRKIQVQKVRLRPRSSEFKIFDQKLKILAKQLIAFFSLETNYPEALRMK